MKNLKKDTEDIEIKKEVDNFLRDVREIRGEFKKEMDANPKLRERLMELE